MIAFLRLRLLLVRIRTLCYCMFVHGQVLTSNKTRNQEVLQGK